MISAPQTVPETNLLRRIVATNGGGMKARDCDQDVLRSLKDRKLVQDQPGSLNFGRVIHAPKGMEWCRANPDPNKLPKPCPICSGAAIVVKAHLGKRVACTSCGTAGPIALNKDASRRPAKQRAISLWNTRSRQA